MRTLIQLAAALTLGALCAAQPSLATSPTRADPARAQLRAANPTPGQGRVAPRRTAASARAFPRPASLKPNIAFWTRIYAEVGNNAGLLHDQEHLNVVYELIRFPRGTPDADRERKVETAKKRYRLALERVAARRYDPGDPAVRRILALWPRSTSPAALRAAARRLRFQRGQSDVFRDGLIRASRFRDHIHNVLRRRGLPLELAVLPHVESSYNPRAYSKAGAAGLWQFIPSTGRRYLRMDGAVDERFDPYRSTEAAAALLEANYRSTGRWPLAITAYNHGAAGVRRAVREVGSENIAVLIQRYKHRRFGFASRNFYCEFLAALDVDRNAEFYFGPLPHDAPPAVETVVTDAHYSVTTLSRAFGIDLGMLRELNPSLRRAVWRGRKRVPPKFTLRVPRREGAPKPAVQLAAIPKGERFAHQLAARTHRVRRGETLSAIARRYGVSLRTLMTNNRLRSAHRIRIGQVLKLPGAPRDPVAKRRGRGVANLGTWTKDRYRVRRGETLASIARRVGVTARELAAVNGIRNPHRIRAGQWLHIPGAGKSDAAAPAAPHGLAATTQPPPQRQHRVRRGETLASIARRYRVSLRSLAAVNGIRNPHRIRVGQLLRIPGIGQSDAAAPAPHGMTTAASPPRRHRVRRGETLAGIARRYRVSLRSLAAVNGIRNPHRVRAGLALRIPAPSVSPGGAAIEPPPMDRES